MRVSDLKNKKIVIWGVGREGHAVAAFIRSFLPQQPLMFVDENPKADAPDILRDKDQCVTGDKIAGALNTADIVIKSPGVSLYHPLITALKPRNIPITSLINLWFAEPSKATTIGITGTKGKSTTSALLAHALTALGKKAVALGNIGAPVTEVANRDLDFIVIEFSSYQAADFLGTCDIGLLTSLYPEHLDWHKSLPAYYRDKLNLLTHSKTKIVNQEALKTLQEYKIELGAMILFNDPPGIHIKDGQVYDGALSLGCIQNAHLSRPHNLMNVCAVLTVIKQLGLDLKTALKTMESFQGLPHRQQELAKKDGILFVDDSISTTPQSAIAAMEAYAGNTITLIAGGYDRGIDYDPLIAYVLDKKIHTVVCMGPSGQRIFEALKKGGAGNIHTATTMPEAVKLARKHTPANGVVLLSPAAPSYGLFKDFVERGQIFAACVKESA